VFGRSKADSIEMDDNTKPVSAHIARVVIEENGEELEIYRRSTPYFGIAERGLYFVAFSAERRRFELMLGRMFGMSGDREHDHLTDFTRPVTGSFWFAPSLDDSGCRGHAAMTIGAMPGDGPDMTASRPAHAGIRIAGPTRAPGSLPWSVGRSIG